jgi:glutathione synthase/RimK-type ligase-like ATP-grasp enzyme
MSIRLAWVTTPAARGWDDDEPLALAAFEAAGVAVEVLDWGDPDVDWASFDRVLLRSTWDYTERPAGFLDWLAAVDAVADLRNPLPMVRWSLDKHYLAELEAAGVPTTPTTYVEPGDRPVLPAGELVVKPAVGAGGRDAASYAEDQVDLALAHVDRLLADGRSVLLQPLLASVPVEGEWPLVFLGGTYSHAASKRVELPRAGLVPGLYAGETLALHVADPAQVAVAQAAVDVVVARFGTPTYARVDLVRGDDGRPMVLEVELVEPSLFLSQAGAEAPARLVAAVLASASRPEVA